jgi:hypothetical protein
MDYSQLLKIRKQGILTAAYRGAIEIGNTVFNRDKKTRGFDNGVVQVFFQKGLYLSSSRGGNAAVGGRIITIPLDINGAPDISGLSAAELQIYTNFIPYLGSLEEYPNLISLQDLEAVLANVTNLPITITYRGNSGSSSARFTGYIADDLASGNSLNLSGIGDLVGFSISYS